MTCEEASVIRAASKRLRKATTLNEALEMAMFLFKYVFLFLFSLSPPFLLIFSNLRRGRKEREGKAAKLTCKKVVRVVRLKSFMESLL